MNRVLLSALIWLSLSGAALAQSIGPAPAVVNPNTVIGPASSTDNAIVRWDGTTGKLVQDSVPLITDIGVITFPGSTTTAPTVAGVGNWAGTLGLFGGGGTLAATVSSTAINLATATSLSWNADVILQRDAANTLGLRNGVNAQTLRVYNTFTDASNYERGIFDWAGSANVLSVGTENAGTGTARNLRFVVGGSSKGDFGITNASHWTFAAEVDSPNGFVGTQYLATANGGTVGWGSRSQIMSPADGILELLNNAATDFTRLQFGGTTSSFPALARNGIKLDVKLSDDSTYAPIAASAHIAAGAVPTLALAGGTCAGTVIAGGASAGTVTLTGACASTNTMTLTVMPTVPVGYACDAVDRTTGTSILAQSATTTSGATFKFSNTTGATDVIAYKCIGY